MTPIQMWEGYNPVKDPLETYIQKCNVLNDIAETEMYFTAESLKDGKIRVYSKMYAHKDWDTSHPAVLFLSDLNASSNYVEISEMLVEQGYVVFVVDYAGFMPDVENPTSFPDSLKYASFEEAKHNLKYMGKNCKACHNFNGRAKDNRQRKNKRRRFYPRSAACLDSRRYGRTG